LLLLLLLVSTIILLLLRLLSVNIGVVLLLLIVGVDVRLRTSSSHGKLSSDGAKGSGHGKNLAALLSVLGLHPSAVVGELLDLGIGGSNPDSVNVEENALVEVLNEETGVGVSHLDEGAAVIGLASRVAVGVSIVAVAVVVVSLTAVVRSGVDDLNSVSGEEEVSELLEGREGHVEGELGNKDITEGSGAVADGGGGGGAGAGPRGDGVTDAAVVGDRALLSDGGGSGDCVEEEIGDVLEEVLHRAAGSTDGGRRGDGSNKRLVREGSILRVLLDVLGGESEGRDSSGVSGSRGRGVLGSVVPRRGTASNDRGAADKGRDVVVLRENTGFLKIFMDSDNILGGSQLGRLADPDLGALGAVRIVVVNHTLLVGAVSVVVVRRGRRDGRHRLVVNFGLFFFVRKRTFFCV